MFRKIIALILVPLFLLSNISFADSIKIGKETLAPLSIVELLSNPDIAAELRKVPQSGGRTADDRIEEFADEWVMRFAALLVKKYIEKAGIKREDIQPIIREDIKDEVVGQIESLAAMGKIPQGLSELLIVALKRELRPGALAGFTGKDLPADVNGIRVRDLFDRVISHRIPGVPILMQDIISKEKQSQLSPGELKIKIFPIKNLVAGFKELFREELKAKGYDEPAREKIINEYALEVISHPGISRKSVYIDSLYYDILTNSGIYENWEDLIIELVKH